MKYKSVTFRKSKNELLNIDELYDLCKKLKGQGLGNYTIEVGYDENTQCTSIRNNYGIDNNCQIVKIRGN